MGKKKINLSAEEKYILIRRVINKHKLKNMVAHFCNISGVSRSGYYRYLSTDAEKTRRDREERDELARVNILKAYAFKNVKKGARQIKMTLEGQFNIVYNLKRIRRIMKKYNIFCPIRKVNPYRKMMKATQEHTVVPNLLNRDFRQGVPGKVLLTDITYLFYGAHKKAYLSTIKDGSTNEILAYNVSTSLEMPLATDTLHKLKESGAMVHEDAFLHSDQGVHYTSPIFQKIAKKYRLKQSMSRRGNCWDNAPQESFYGHFKDEISIKSCTTIHELVQEVDRYMDYYNNYRYQWNLKKMTPVQYRDHLLSQL